MNLTTDESTWLKNKVATTCHHQTVAEPSIADITARTGASERGRIVLDSCRGRQLCWFWEAGKSSVLRVCHRCLCPSNIQKQEEHRVQDLQDHLNTAGHAIRDAGSRAQATENLSRHAETAAGAAGEALCQLHW